MASWHWRFPGSHPRIEITPMRCHSYAPPSFTPHGYNIYCMSYRIFTDMSVKTSKAPTKNRTHVSTLRFSRLYLLENKIFMFCGISGSWGSDVIVSEVLYKKRNLIGVFWLKVGHIKHLLTHQTPTDNSQRIRLVRGGGGGGGREGKREFTWK